MGMNNHRLHGPRWRPDTNLAAWEVRYRIPSVFAPTIFDAVSFVEAWAMWFARERIKTAKAIVRTEKTETPIPR